MADSKSQELLTRIREFSPWFHNLHFPDGTQTAPSWRARVRRSMIFQTMTLPGREVVDQLDHEINERDLLLATGWPKMAFIGHRLAGDPTNWWIPNHAGVEALLRSAGMRITGYPGHKIYLCEPNPDSPSCVTTWNAGEYASATGTGF